MSKHIGTGLRISRKLADVTVRQMAKALGKSHQAVADYEYGKYYPSSTELIAWADTTGFSVNCLLSSPDMWNVLLQWHEEREQLVASEVKLAKILERRKEFRDRFKTLPRRRTPGTQRVFEYHLSSKKKQSEAIIDLNQEQIDAYKSFLEEEATS